MMKKNIVRIICCIFIITAYISPCFAENNDIATTQYYGSKSDELLISYGYPADFLALLTPSILSQMAENMDDSVVSKVTINTKTQDERVLIKTAIAELQDIETQQITGAYICVYWEWIDKQPFIRWEDSVFAQWDNNIFSFEADSFYAEDFWRSNTGDSWVVSNTYIHLAGIKQNELQHWTDLNETHQYVGSGMIFKLSTTEPIMPDVKYDDNIYVNYEHYVGYDYLNFTNLQIMIISAVFLLSIVILTIVIVKIRKKRCLR